MGKAYGFFEIPSVTAAVVAVDIMCKTADVQFVTWEKKLGGRLVTIIIRGDVPQLRRPLKLPSRRNQKTSEHSSDPKSSRGDLENH